MNANETLGAHIFGAILNGMGLGIFVLAPSWWKVAGACLLLFGTVCQMWAFFSLTQAMDDMACVVMHSNEVQP